MTAFGASGRQCLENRTAASSLKQASHSRAAGLRRVQSFETVLGRSGVGLIVVIYGK